MLNHELDPFALLDVVRDVPVGASRGRDDNYFKRQRRQSEYRSPLSSRLAAVRLALGEAFLRMP